MTPKIYEGTKRLHAQPMTRGEYNAYRGWENPADENPADDGYLVEYQDGGKANDPRHAGYISWSPKDVFERSYKEIPQSSLPPHQQRVLDEKRELDEKLQKLTAFISSEKFSTIVQDEAERGRLVCQEETMKDYSAILAERIEAFGAAPIALPVIDPGHDSLEREIQAKASNGPRVTPADIEAEIASEHYFTAEDGVGRASKGQTSNGGKNPASLSLLTFCVLVLRNGFTVTGESACASPENFNAEIGRRIARENAVAKVWPLLGFRLRDKLSGGLT